LTILGGGRGRGGDYDNEGRRPGEGGYSGGGGGGGRERRDGPPPMTDPDAPPPAGQGLTLVNLLLNLNALYEIGGARRVCVAPVRGFHRVCSVCRVFTCVR